MFLWRAMRYYRIWIYTCNAVLLVGVLVFVITSGCLLADYRASFLPVPLYHPTLIYGYLALALQSGMLQFIGCVGALRLNERWLNAYWLLLLLLLLGDILVGVVWAVILAGLQRNLDGVLLARLQSTYGEDSDFTLAWDKLQQQRQCCGVFGPRDYWNTTKWVQTVLERKNPHVNGTAGIQGTLANGGTGNVVLLVQATDYSPGFISLPESCCAVSFVGDSFGSGVNGSGTCLTDNEDVFRPGCGGQMREWLQHGADLLFVLGYCVLAFLKLCFLGILRYEIKEMIEKIKILKGDMPDFPELMALGLRASTGTLTATGATSSTPATSNTNSRTFSGHISSPLLPEKSASHPNHLNSLLNHHHNHHHHHHNHYHPLLDHIVGSDIDNVTYKKNPPNGNNNDLELLELTTTGGNT